MGVLYLLVIYYRYFVLESYRFFHGNVINIALIICLIKLCLLLSGDIEQNPGPTQGDTTHTLQSSISICHLNIRSLRNKIDDIVKKKRRLVCFTETHLDERVPTNNLVIPSFNSNPFRLDRNTYGGGIMMYFKDNIKIVPGTDLQVDGVEAMWFEIKSKVGNILLNIIYSSQIETRSLFWRNFSQMVRSALDYSSKTR